ncbi:hypothetical protein M409DRAFT_17006 [Zasmidium cellare ATCC 36951]|uniref:FAD/NAD(P)-binding domain-containing protein n=1 Tax=Zasmidium cellare ATCC 36951 TaxID=1080233 RepID=A0A6A6D5W4_ZASCE|nr:uncharacterized protein M409DRAFT_17006 [Zasmidium cellare ATCC 36951]KAF2173056.1 hypothetical protein M409DRAFT_17006 [Zasmidium cellare ATCC 36951]
MSAIPNVPEAISHSQHNNADAALTHLLKAKQGAAQHIEHAANGPQVNGEHGVKAKAPWVLHDVPIENQRPIKVIVIGAGYSGIYLGIRIPERIRNCELVIYEKNDGIGGTWYENRYPGAACDIPSHSYQFSFNPKPDWSSLYAPSWEIRDYLQESARKYGADRFMKLNHEVKGCTWDQNHGKWHVQVQRPDGSIFQDDSDVLVSARGNLNNKAWPDIPGLSDFKGEVMHSAAWNESYDFTNKRIGIIGSGSSAIQIIPKLQKIPGAHLSCFIRSKTWISPPLGQSSMDALGMGTQLQFQPEQIETFKKDPEAWYRFRMKVESDANNIHAMTLKGTEMQRAAEKAFDEGMRTRLARKPEYYEWLKPSFAPGCRRLTPGPGFLEALVEENVEFVREKITWITSDGIVTADGRTHLVDVLVCATGFHASAAPPFPITGLAGETLSTHWATRPTTYLSLTTDAFPNHFLMLGPNAAIGEGSLTMMIESTGTYILSCIRKLQRENIKSMRVKPARVRDFMAYVDAYFEGTVYVDECRSWYRQGGDGKGEKVTGLWPGSTLHCVEALRGVRWEDFLYEYVDAGEEGDGRERNVLGWLGNGWSTNQLKDSPTEEELAWYLTPQFQAREIPLEGRPEQKEEYRLRPWSY